MTEEDLARYQLLREKPFEHVIAGTRGEYKTYLWATGKKDLLDADFIYSPNGLSGRHMDTIVLLGDRWSASPACNGDILKALSRDNIIVERHTSGVTRRYWDATE